MKIVCHIEKKSNKVIGFNQLLDIFGTVPYIITNKQCVRDFMKMIIFCQEKTYDGHRYFNTSLKCVNLKPDDKLKFESLREKIYERIKEFKQQSVLDITDFDEL